MYTEDRLVKSSEVRPVANSGQRASSSAVPCWGDNFQGLLAFASKAGRHFKQQLEFYAVSDVNCHGFKVGDPH